VEKVISKLEKEFILKNDWFVAEFNLRHFKEHGEKYLGCNCKQNGKGIAK
jgi:hypothetical protein